MKRYDYKAPSEWGSKARKAEANQYRGRNDRAAIAESLNDMDED